MSAENTLLNVYFQKNYSKWFKKIGSSVQHENWWSRRSWWWFYLNLNFTEVAEHLKKRQWSEYKTALLTARVN